MALDPALTGRTFTTAAPYHVSVEKIAEFAAAIGVDVDADEDVDEDPRSAPYTFPMVVAFGRTIARTS